MTDYLAEAEKALNYLRDSEAEYAEYKGLVKYQPDRLKATLARLYLNAPGKTVQDRKAHCEAHSDYDAAIAESIGIQTRFTEIEAKRKRAEMTIEMYRSVNSALKRGNI